jgi:hypothetical protein
MNGNFLLSNNSDFPFSATNPPTNPSWEYIADCPAKSNPSIQRNILVKIEPV